jgi:DNA-binding NarL/FixJ family response regulator
MPGGFTAVVVDSEELFGAGLRSIVARDRSNLRALVSTSFDSALETLGDSAQIQLAIIDVDARGMNGAASLGRLRGRFPAIRILLAAARADDGDVGEYLAWGANGVILKTLSSREIANAIRVVVSGGLFVKTSTGEPARSADPRHPPLLQLSGPPAGQDDHAVVMAGLLRMHQSLSVRQTAVLRLLAAGLSNKAIARQLGLAEGTVKVHVNAIFKALQVRNRASATAIYTTRQFSDVPRQSRPTVDTAIREDA